MFSARTAGPRDKNPLAVAIEQMSARVDLVDLTVSNPTQVGLPIDVDAVAAALAEGAKESYAPAPLGLEAARVAVADYYGRRGVAVDPAQVFLTASTSEAYAFVLRLLADPGQGVLAARPSYPLFEALTHAADLTLDTFALEYDEGWRLPEGALEAATHGRTRAVLHVNPGNPTGACLSVVDRRRLLAFANERGVPVVSDEVFLDYVDPPEGFAARSFAREARGLTFTLSGLSKVAALPHLKLSWGVVTGPEADVAEALARLELHADTFLSVAGPVQHALPKLLELAEPLQGHLMDRLRANSAELEARATAVGLRVRRRDGGWYALLDLPAGLDDEQAAIGLVQGARVITQPGYLYDLEDRPSLVLSLLPEPETFTEGLEAALEHLAKSG